MVSSTLQVLARSRIGQGDAAGGERLLRESLELRRRTMPPGLWLLASSESILGDCLTGLGRYEEAETLLTRSLTALRIKLGEKHPRTREAADRLARLESARPVRPGETR